MTSGGAIGAGGAAGVAPREAHASGTPLRLGVLAGSPNAGSCERLARIAAAAAGRATDEASDAPMPSVEVTLARLRDFGVAPCRGCNACARTGTCVLFDGESRARARGAAGGDAGAAGAAGAGGPDHAACGAGGNFLDLFAWLDSLDALLLVAPVYFAGPPAQLKAALDRLQFLWARRYPLGLAPALPRELRRPLSIAVVGSGGDPFGHDALVTCARSALRMADFELADTLEVIGYRASGADPAADERFEARVGMHAASFARRVVARGLFSRRGQASAPVMAGTTITASAPATPSSRAARIGSDAREQEL